MSDPSEKPKRVDHPASLPVWLNADEAAARLGITKPTLYAYVSRGRITRELDESGRRSRFDATEIAALATGRARPARPGHVELRVGTAVTRLDETSLSYRGEPISGLIGHKTFEEVAALLWQRPVPGWSGTDVATRAAAGVWGPRQSVLHAGPGTTAALLARAVLAVGSTDDYRADLRPDAVVASVAGLIGSLGASLPGIGRHEDGLADRLARFSAPSANGSSSHDLPRILDAALVSLADHEMATSTFAVRIAASTRADPYAAIAAGLAVLSGPLHGSVSADVAALLERSHGSGRPARAVAERLGGGGVIPGFGHKVYRVPDPRFTALMTLLDASGVDRGRLATVRSVVSEARDRVPREPNVDFALGALSFCFRLPPSTGELVFALARIAGWTAHYLEELDEPGLRYRVRAVYRGR